MLWYHTHRQFKIQTLKLLSKTFCLRILQGIYLFIYFFKKVLGTFMLSYVSTFLNIDVKIKKTHVYKRSCKNYCSVSRAP